MARHQDKDDDRIPKNTAPSSEGGGAIIAVVFALLVVFAGLIFFSRNPDPVDGQIVESAVADARPTGAGTLPDGEADEVQEGLANETDQGDFIDPSAPTSATPDPLMDVSDGDAPTVSSIEALDPGPAVDDEVLDRMAPDDN